MTSEPGGATPVELIRALAAFAEPPGEEHAALADALGLGSPPSPSDFSDVFLFHLYPYASVYVGGEGMMGGDARERVAGFWRALGRTPPAEPDHLAALLGLYASISAETDEAAGPRGPTPGAAPATPEATLLAQGRDALLHEHLAPWLPAYLGRVTEIGSGAYVAWAEMLQDVVALELERVGLPTRLPLHLREAPALPDPRTEGTSAFLDGLLAPVRTGVIVTRADLAAVASTSGLGLRAGERRYALDHLLGQDAAAVLRALGDEAARQAALHAVRQPTLGITADFMRDRASATARLLDELATEASTAAEPATGTARSAPAVGTSR